MQNQKIIWMFLGVGLLLAAIGGGIVAASCSSNPPSVVINSPRGGAQATAGQEVTVQSLATDPKGILRVELAVDNTVVAASEAPSPQPSFMVVHNWKAAGAGPHTLIVRAYNKDGARTESQGVQITVNAAPTPVAQATPTAQPTAVPPTKAPAPTSAPAPGPIIGGCVNDARFAADITVPDGTQFNPNEPFKKVWRMTNQSMCPWTAVIQLAYVDGDFMSAKTRVVPVVGSVPPGGTVDFAVDMVAPANPGPYVGRWRLQTEDGQFFGDKVDIKINVRNPAPPPACSGTPRIEWFKASATNVSVGSNVTLGWGGILNAERAELLPGIGGVPGNSSVTVHMEQTTVFTLKAYCGSNAVQQQVQVNVASPVAPPSAAVVEPPPNYVGSTSHPLHIVYQASGNADLRRVELYGNNNLLTAQDLSGSRMMRAAYDWSVGAGRVEIYALAFDTLGQVGKSPVLVIEIKAPAPNPTPVPPTPVPPQRPSIDGEWSSGKYMMELEEALLGCPLPTCHVNGRWIEITAGAPDIVDISGTFNGTTLRMTVPGTLPGAPTKTYTGNVSSNGRSISGNLDGAGLNFNKQ